MVSAQDMKVLHTGINMVGADPETIDPGISQASQGNQIITLMFVGLTSLDGSNNNTLPAMASDWTISDDGLVYTFNLIQEVPWVHYNPDTDAVEQVMDADGNPRYVTAHDFEYGIKRMLDPATASPYAFLPMQYIAGATEFNSGEGSADDVAVTAIDDYTLEITALESLGFNPTIYGLWMNDAVPQWAIDECGDSWTEADCINTYGPFAMKDWEHDVNVTVVKNPFWPGTVGRGQAKLDEVVLHFLDPQAQMAEYEAGTLDAISPPIEEMDRIKADPTLSSELIIAPRFCTYYVGINLEKPPLSDSVHLRRALSYAVDRQSIVDNVTKGGQEPARWFARPGLAAAPTMETHPDVGIGYDPDMAQAELALALDELGVASVDEIPSISLGYNDSSGHAAIMQAIQQMWSDTLGITVQLSAMDSTTYFTVLHEDAPQVYRSGWCLDYPDANNFNRDVLRSDSTFNDEHFVNAEYDALVDQARTMTDNDARRELYAQAENIVSRDVTAIINIYWYTFVQLTKPYVERTTNVTGREYYEQWDLPG
jgi:oligopeptide transport system substrate-binding protein